MDSTDIDNAISLAVAPLPFDSSHTIYAHVTAGGTLESILDSTFRQHPGVYYFVAINGQYIPRDQWRFVRPNAGTYVTVKAIPQGDDKNPLGTILSIAVLAGAPYLAGVIGPSLGIQGTLGLKLLGAGIGLVGNLLVNQLVPPPKPNQFGTSVRESPTFDITGARNQARLFGPVPQLLGTYRFVPPYAAQPYTESQNNQQFLRAAFCLTKGQIEFISNRIGENDVENFEEVELEVREGFDDDPPRELLTDDVFEEILSVKVEQSAGRVIRTTQPGVDEAIVQLTHPNGLIRFEDDGDKTTQTVQYTIEYRKVGTTPWTAGADNYARAAQEYTPPLGRTIANPIAAGSQEIPAAGEVYIDRHDGRLLTRVLKTTVNGTPNGFPFQTPVPANGYLICSWERTSAGVTTIQDMRTPAVKANFVNDTDFAPSVDVSNNVDLAAGTLILGFSNTGKTAQTIRVSKRIVFPTNDQYEIAVTRNTADNTNTQVFNDMFWNSLKSITHTDPITEPNMAISTLRIRASNQLNGIIDTYNVTATSLAKGWDGTIWRDFSLVNNPSGLIRLVLQGDSNKKAVADSKIDLTSLQEFWEWCRDNGFTYNRYIDYSVSVADLLQEIASAGRGAIARTEGNKIGVIIDKEQSNIRQHFTPRNSSNFKGTKAWASETHALRVRFPNELNDYRQDERIVYADGYNVANATKIETLELPGVTHPDQVFKLARYHLAVARLRPETFTFDVDFEQLVITRGDRFKLSHDVPQLGLGSARIKSLTLNVGDITHIELDDTVQMSAGNSYVLRVRDNVGGSVTYPIVTNVGDQTTLQLVTATAQGTTAVGDLAMFGIENIETEDLVVKAIRPRIDMTAQIVAVNYIPWDEIDLIGSIPPYQSNISQTPGLESPVIEDIISDETVLSRNPDGTFSASIFVALAFANNRDYSRLAGLEVQYKINVGTDTPYDSLPTLQPEAETFIITPVDDGEQYEIRLRYKFKSGEAGPWTTTTHTVTGATGNPPALDSFNVTEFGDGTRQYSFALANKPPDWDGIELRYASGTESNYDNLISLVDGIIRTSPYESALPLLPGTYSFGAESVDLNGNKSGNPVVISGQILGASRLGTAFYTEDVLQSGFPGTKTSCHVDASTGFLIPTPTDIWSDYTTNWSSNTTWGDELPTQIIYEHTIIDIGELKTLTPTITIVTDGGTQTLEERHNTELPAWNDSTLWSDMTTWETGAGFTSYATITATPFAAEQVQIRITIDNPGAQGIKALIISLV